MSGQIYDWSVTASENDDADASINWSEGQLPSTVNNSARAVMAALASWLKDVNGTITTGGSANVQTIASPNIAYAAHATGIILGFKAGFSNSGAATLNVNSLGAKAIRKGADIALVGGEILSGGHYTVRYDAAANSAAGAWMLLNPSLAGAATFSSVTVSGSVTPSTSGAGSLGSGTLRWANVYINTLGAVDFANGDVAITHAANVLTFTGGSSGYLFDAIIAPTTSNGAPLGSTGLMWSDLFLASGAVIDFNGGDVTLTHSANALAFAGAASGYTFDALVSPAASDGAALGSTTLPWSDLHLALGAVINFNAGDVSITHSANTLTFDGASSGYLFDAGLIPTVSDGGALGSVTKMWADLFLAANGVINFNNGNVTITHSAGLLTFGGATNILPSTNDATALGSNTLMFADLFLANGAVINFNNGNTTLTHSNTVLTMGAVSATFRVNATSGNATIHLLENGTTRWQIFNNVAGSNTLNILDSDSSHGVSLDQNTGTWASVSDARLKRDFVPISVRDRMKAGFELVEFTWKNSGRQDVGVTAQNFAKVFPEWVKAGDDEDREVSLKTGGVWSIMEAKAGLAALAYAHEVDGELMQLAGRVAALEARG